MRTDEDYLRELELFDTFQQIGRVPQGAAVARPEMAPENAAHEARIASNPPPPQAAKTAAVAPIRIDHARIARIANMDWAALQEEAATCRACELCEHRKKTVFGVGALSAAWLFVGEGPGAEEDEAGEPFVGPAGKLLDAMLAATGLQRGREVYIANVVKCRPPGNRTPTTNEAAACAPLLDRQIDLLQPALIVALGKTAVMRLGGAETSMVSLRGKLHNYRDIPMVATYHPAYLLRSLTEKLKGWEDMLFAKHEMAKLVASKAENA